MNFFSFLLFFPAFLSATQLSPWFGPDLWPQIELGAAYQHYSHVHEKNHSTEFHSDDLFIHSGISAAILGDYSVEVELNGAQTSHHSFNFEDFRLTARTLLLNDVSGDPVSLSIGFTGNYANTPFVNDLSTFHHGTWEGAIHAAIGKEWTCEDFWMWRLWAVSGVGIANEGSPWIFTKIAYDNNHWDYWQWGLYTEALGGFGSHALKLTRPFHGYGPIQHRSLDAGAYMNYHTFCIGTISLEYAYRLYAYNFPAEAQRIKLTVTIPFGL